MGKALGNIDFPPIIYYLPRAIPTRSADFFIFVVYLWYYILAYLPYIHPQKYAKYYTFN